MINASNLHVGGGVQVAASFLTELSNTQNFPKNLFITVSSELHSNTRNLDLNSRVPYTVLDTKGFFSYSLYKHLLSKKPKVVFTIFGPLYFTLPNYKSIMGFAQPWIIYPNNECCKVLSVSQRIKTRLKYWIQGLFFKRADILIVELEHVKQGLIRALGIPPARIYVVHNCLSALYLNKSSWHQIEFPRSDAQVNLGFLGRNYLHKNTRIFPAIAEELKNQYNLKVRFFVTFTEQEWLSCTDQFRAACINVGPLSVAQCPPFYRSLDAVVFPSLLECFSATPLEAMAMERPLFASDRPFNRDVCGPHAHYFDPLDPSSAARVIANVFIGKGPDPVALEAAREHAVNFSSPKERAEKYLALLMGENPDNLTKI